MTPWRIAAALLVLAGPALAQSPITIGVVYPLATPQGADARHAVETALDIVNTKHDPVPLLMGQGGGLDRLGNASLVAAYEDDANDPAAARAAAERLVSDHHAIALVGGLSDATVAAISGVAEIHGIPFISLDTTEANHTGLTWFFHIGRTPDLDARTSLRFLAAIPDRKLQTIALIGEDSPQGRDAAAALRRAATDAALTIVADLKVPPAATSLAAEALVIAGTAPDAILCALGTDHTADLLTQLAAQPAAQPAASKPLILANGTLLRDPAAIARLGVPADRLLRSAAFMPGPNPARPGLDAAAAAYQARAGKPLEAAAARELTGTLLLADVINRAASTKPIDLRTALMATDTPGSEILLLWDGIRFDDSGQNVLATPAFQQVQQGALQIVAPDPVATAPPTWPK